MSVEHFNVTIKDGRSFFVNGKPVETLLFAYQPPSTKDLCVRVIGDSVDLWVSLAFMTDNVIEQFGKQAGRADPQGGRNND